MAKAESESIFIELGQSGLRRSGGYVREEFLRELQGPRGMRVYREMRDNSAIIGAALQAIEMLIRQVSWDVEPYVVPGAQEPTLEAEARAEFLESCTTDLSTTWTETVGEFLTMLPYGFAPCEIVYRRRDGEASGSSYDDGLIGWRKLALRAQETVTRWEIDPQGGIQGLYQQAEPDFRERFIPIDRLLLFRARTERNNPEGRSVLRNAYRSYTFAKNLEVFEAIGTERDLTGLPVATVPYEALMPGANPAMAALASAMAEIVRNIKADEQAGVVLPAYFDDKGHQLVDLKLLSSPGTKQVDTSKLIERHERRAAMAMLADLILLGHEQVGSYNLGNNKQELLAVALNGWLDVVAGILNTHAVPRLWALNGWPVKERPKFCHERVEGDNLAALGDFVSKLTAAGFNWTADRGVHARLRRAAGMPKAPKDLPITPAPSPGAATPPAPPPEPPEPPDTSQDDTEEA
jgi:hypothetical protein